MCQSQLQAAVQECHLKSKRKTARLYILMTAGCHISQQIVISCPFAHPSQRTGTMILQKEAVPDEIAPTNICIIHP